MARKRTDVVINTVQMAPKPKIEAILEEPFQKKINVQFGDQTSENDVKVINYSRRLSTDSQNQGTQCDIGPTELKTTKTEPRKQQILSHTLEKMKERREQYLQYLYPVNQLCHDCKKDQTTYIKRVLKLKNLEKRSSSRNSRSSKISPNSRFSPSFKLPGGISPISPLKPSPYKIHHNHNQNNSENAAKSSNSSKPFINKSFLAGLPNKSNRSSVYNSLSSMNIKLEKVKINMANGQHGLSTHSKCGNTSCASSASSDGSDFETAMLHLAFMNRIINNQITMDMVMDIADFDLENQMEAGQGDDADSGPDVQEIAHDEWGNNNDGIVDASYNVDEYFGKLIVFENNIF